MPQFELNSWDGRLCQHVGCSDSGSKVCHHLDCQLQNNQRPLILCESCDYELHSAEHYNGHLRLDLRPHGTVLGRSISTRSCPAGRPPSDPDITETLKDDGTIDEIDGSKVDHKEKPTRKSKLQRKKAYRRHHTDVARSHKALETVNITSNDGGVATAHTPTHHNADKLPRKSSIKKDQSRAWFSLKFDVLDKDDVEIVAAIKGRTLREALEGIFSVRKMNIDSVNIFLDQSNTPLPLQFETYPLGGHSLIVKAKGPVKDMEDFRRSHLYNVSARTRVKSSSKEKEKEKDKKEEKLKGSQRGLKNIISMIGDTMSPLQQPSFTSFTATPPQSSDSFRRPPISRLGDVFMSKEKEKLQALTEKLDYYSTHGIPEMPDLLTLHRKKENDQENLYALGAWTDIVDGIESMTKKERDQQEAVWEILVTEVKYIHKLKVITEVFFSSLLNLQNEWLLNEIDSEKIFSNIQKLLEVHEDFWIDKLVHIVNTSRESREPLSAELIADAFIKFEKRFGGYVRYCIEEYSCVNYMKAQMKENDLFRTFVEWAENQKQCNRLRLSDLLVGPMQRLTKYPLLLKAVAAKTEDSPIKDALKNAIKDVEKFIFKINRALKLRHERKKLEAIQSRIEHYDVIESTNEELSKLVDEYVHFNLCSPMPGANPTEQRLLLLDGQVKLRDQEGKIDVIIFLFTDMMLITKTSKRGEKIKIVKPCMRIDRIVTRELKDSSGFLLVYLDDYGLAMWAYTVLVPGVGQSRVWLQNIYKAKHLYREAVKRQRALNAPTSAPTTPLPREDNSDDDRAVVSPRQTNRRKVPELGIPRRKSSDSTASTDSSSLVSHSSQSSFDKSRTLDGSPENGENLGISKPINRRSRAASDISHIQRRKPVQLTHTTRPVTSSLPYSPDSSVPSSAENSPRLTPDDNVKRHSILPNRPLFLKLSRSASDRSGTNDEFGQKSDKSTLIKKRMSWGPSSTEEESLKEKLSNIDKNERGSPIPIIIEHKPSTHKSERESPIPRIIEHKASSMMNISVIESSVIPDNQGTIMNHNRTNDTEGILTPFNSVGMSRLSTSETSIPEVTNNNEHIQESELTRQNSPRRYASETAIPDKVDSSCHISRESQSTYDLTSDENTKYNNYESETNNSNHSLPTSPQETQESPVRYILQEQDMKDGIKSVKVEGYRKSAARRKLTHADIIRLRKNLILTATTTASEV